MTEILLLFLVTTVMVSVVLSAKYQWGGVAASLIIEGFLLFLVVFFTPIGPEIWPYSAELARVMGAWTWILALSVMFVAILGVATSLSPSTTIRGKLREGYHATFYKIPWSAFGPFVAFFFGAGAYTGMSQKPSEALALVTTQAGGWETYIAFVAVAVAFLIPVAYMVLRRR